MKNIRLSALMLLLTLCCMSMLTVEAQDSKLKKADDLFEVFNFPEAAEAYKKILAKDPEVGMAKVKLAECYRHMNMPIEAEYWYEQAVDLAESQPVHKFFYGMSLKANGKFEEAKQVFLEYAQLVPADTRGLRQVEACEQANYFLTDPGIYQVAITNINSPNADFGPAFYKEGIVFASEEGVKDKSKTYDWREASFLDLFYAPIEGDNPAVLGAKELFEGKVNTWVHEGTVSFTSDFQTMYLTRNSINKGRLELDKDEIVNTVNLQIFESKANGDKWGVGTALPFNSPNYSVGHPALSPDGQALYFVSDMEGGYQTSENDDSDIRRNTDIYVSYKSGEGWGQPQNLGPEINTEGREMFPFMAKDGTLYFASDALPGLGGLDIFSTSYNPDDGTWTTPENLRYPINTNADDFAFIINEQNDKGYFSSNRSGGQGDDDIYSFTKLTNIMVGIVVDCVTDEPIDGSEVQLMENGRLMQRRKSNANGQFTFPISPGKEYEVKAEKATYEPNQIDVSTIGMNGTQIDVKIPLCQDGPKELCKLSGTITVEQNQIPLPNANVILTNVVTKEEQKFTTGEDGQYIFEVEPNTDYTLYATKQYYFSVTEAVSTVGQDCSKNVPLSVDIPITKIDGTPTDDDIGKIPGVDGDPLTDNGNSGGGTTNFNNGSGGGGNTYTPVGPGGDGIVISDNGQYTGIPGLEVLNHIYYDFDKHYIRDDAKPELDKIVRFMN
ncbi:MAG: carboxypeptidase regulatory-like domain-containing protein, partial [Chitinophagales bacterium]